jgi:DNA-binding response OmpR family regulator
LTRRREKGTVVDYFVDFLRINVPYRIILADPSPSVQKMAQLVFAEPEFRLAVFEDGTSLLESVADLRPDALLISLSLPGRDGYEVGRSVRSRKDLATVPLIGLRGTFECVDADRSAPPDYDEVVQKPFDSERLAGIVRDLIARKTGPSSLPEEPVWPGEESPADAPGPAAPAPPGAATGPGIKDIVRQEIVGMEREIEKRVRARVLAEIKEWLAGDGKASGPKE